MGGKYLKKIHIDNDNSIYDSAFIENGALI